MHLKPLFLVLLYITLSPAQSFMEPAYGLWGFGATVKERNYPGTETIYSPSPLIFGGYGPIWIEANRLGYTFFRSGGWFASVAAQIRSHQFRKDDAPLEDRPQAIEAGVQAGYRLPGNLTARLALLQDVSGRHKSWEADLQLYTHFFPGPFSLLTAAGVQYQSARLADYYYGVSGYTPGEALVGELESILTLPVGDFGVFVGARLWFFDKAVGDSPIADGNRVSNIFMGVGYYFD